MPNLPILETAAAEFASKTIVALAAFALAGCTTTELVGAQTATQPVSQESTPALTDADGYTGRIRLTRYLDEPDGYCLDVPGPASSPMLNFPVVAHTCHADPLVDQVFEFNVGGEGYIRWLTDEHDLCFTAKEAESLSPLYLKDCAQSELQSFVYTDGDELQLAATDLCIHVERRGPGPFEEVPRGQDDYGRGRSVNPQFTHLVRRLQLRECGLGDPSMFRWTELNEPT